MTERIYEMKKLLVILIAALIFVNTTCYAKVGDVIGDAYHTDIVAYINNYAIPSYAVNGTSCIVAEDLRNFCFDVIWNDSNRSLNIHRNSSSQPIGMNFSKTGIASTKYADLLETDISVYANGQRITSYAINGYTMIPIEELNTFGKCTWVESERAIVLWVNGINGRQSKQIIGSTNNTTTNSSYSTNQNITSSGYECYPGTNIPTYTEITGIASTGSGYLDNGLKYYKYPDTQYGEYHETTDYAAYFIRRGWTELSLNNDDVRYYSIAFCDHSTNEMVLIMVDFLTEQVFIIADTRTSNL